MFFPDFREKKLPGLGLLPLAPWPTVRDLAGHQPLGVPGALHPCRAGLLRPLPPWLKMVAVTENQFFWMEKWEYNRGINSWDSGILVGSCWDFHGFWLDFEWTLMDFVSKNEGSSREKYEWTKKCDPLARKSWHLFFWTRQVNGNDQHPQFLLVKWIWADMGPDFGNESMTQSMNKSNNRYILFFDDIHIWYANRTHIFFYTWYFWPKKFASLRLVSRGFCFMSISLMPFAVTWLFVVVQGPAGPCTCRTWTWCFTPICWD